MSWKKKPFEIKKTVLCVVAVSIDEQETAFLGCSAANNCASPVLYIVADCIKVGNSTNYLLLENAYIKWWIKY